MPVHPVLDDRAGPAPAGDEAASPALVAPWHVLWTSSHCEDLVFDQLKEKNLHPFLPKVDVWSVRAGRRRLVAAPMFPGYLFLNDRLDKARYVEVRKARGLVRLLGEGWDRPAEVPEAEIESIRRLATSGAPSFAHPYLRAGRRARIVSGPLAGVEGILKRVDPAKGILVISVHLLQRSVAVEVDCTQVVPA